MSVLCKGVRQKNTNNFFHGFQYAPVCVCACVCLCVNTHPCIHSLKNRERAFLQLKGLSLVLFLNKQIILFWALNYF